MIESSPSQRIPCYIFDIDGTLSNPSHRLHHIQKEPKDWDAFYDACDQDDPIETICNLAVDLEEADNWIVMVTGRPERIRKKTYDWLYATVGLTPSALYMRKDGDHRPDYEVKAELLEQVRADGYEPVLVFEDRTQVVEMWRRRGIPCAQVAKGDF